MEPVVHKAKLQQQFSREDLEQFDIFLKEAVDKPWWRLLVKIVEDRRNMFLMTLVASEMDQRGEDRLRGQISELNFILTLDSRGLGMLDEEREGRNAI